MKIGAAILAGGHSRRMGKDKARLLYRGESFIQRIAAELEGFEELIVSVDVPGRYEEIGAVRFVDIYKNCGPKGGIHAALESCRSDALLVLPCDIPLFKRELGEYLCSALGDSDAVVPSAADGRKNPLCAVYRKSCAAVFEAELAAGEYRMTNSLTKLNVRYVALDDKFSAMLRNINTPLDYQSLEAEAGGEPK